MKSEKDAHMVTTIKTAVSIQKSFADEAEILAQHLNISRSHLFRIVIEDFLKNYQSHLLLVKEPVK